MKCQAESQKLITIKDMGVSWYSQAEVVTTFINSTINTRNVVAKNTSILRF